MPKQDIKKFKHTVWDYYRKHGRTLPWRETADPYRILVSEIMLQQTQVSRVTEKYREFLKRFPTVKKLASASVGDVLKVWQGLGYNRRALNLKKAAELIVKDYNGKIPSDPDLLTHLPGIGKGTAGAICAYAFNLPVPYIETNIRRVYIHFFFKDKASVSDSDILPLVEKTVDTVHAREWYWALMDYGSFLPKTVTNPNRQSKHYVKQSKFAGSNRQKRGLVIAYLVKHGKATVVEMDKVFKFSSESIVDQLVQEGFLKKQSRYYIIS